MLFDTHAHLDDEAFDLDREEVISNIKNSGIKHFVNIGTTVDTSIKAIKLADKYDFIYATVGIHPHDVGHMTYEDLQKIEELTKHKKVVAIGEIGLDYYYDNSPRDLQKKWFVEQIHLSERLELPFVIHSRDASQDTYDILKSNVLKTKFVLHSFSQSSEMLKRYLELGGYISFSGALTFKNAKNLQEAIKYVPLDRLLVETDSPYLSPVPMRGKRNTPLNVEYTAKFAADLLEIDYDKFCDITFNNSLNFFNLKK